MSNLLNWLDTQIARETEARDQYWMAAVKQVGILTGRLEAFQEIAARMRAEAVQSERFVPDSSGSIFPASQPLPEPNGVLP